MHSPLPDSSALEAGILPDDQPSRLSRVQDNVRNLLRASILGSPIRSAPPTTPTHPAGIPPTPPETPTHSPPLRAHPEVLPSPTASPTSTTSSASLTHHEADLEANTATGLFPPPSYPSPLLARMSAFFTGRALAALNHPDLDLQGSGGGDPGAAVLAQRRAEKRQRRAWKRKRSGAGSREGGGSGQCVLCVVAALMLASVVATCEFCRRSRLSWLI